MRVHQFKALVFWCRDAKKALAFPKNSFSFSNSRTRRRRAVISASISRGSGRPCWAAWRLSRSSLTHRPTTDSPSPKSRATDAIVDPVSNTRHATSRRYSGVKRRRVPITGTSLSAGTRTRFTKCQQHQPKPTASPRRQGIRLLREYKTEVESAANSYPVTVTVCRGSAWRLSRDVTPGTS